MTLYRTEEICRGSSPWVTRLYLLVLVLMGLWLRSFSQNVNAAENPLDMVYLRQSLERQVTELGYDAAVSRSCADLTLSWHGWSRQPLMLQWARHLQQGKAQRQTDQWTPEQYGRLQRSIARRLRDQMHNAIYAHADVYDLSDVVAKHQAQCLGFTQLYDVLARSLGLDCVPVNVLRTAEDRSLPPGQGHLSCMVRCADQQVIMFDLVNPDTQSHAFVFAEQYERQGVTWRLCTKQNPLHLFTSIQCLNTAGLRAQLLNSHGADCSKAGQWQEALAYFNRAVQQDAHAVKILNNRAGANLRCGHLDQALADSQRCLAFNTELAGPYNTRGMIYTRLNRLDEALKDFNEALVLAPDFTKAYNNRGCVYNRTGHYRTAIDDFNRALRLNHHYLEAYHNRANAYARLGNYQQAIKSYTAAQRCNPQQQQVYLSRGLVYAIVGQDQRACADLRTAVQLSPALRPKVERIVNHFGLDLPLADASVQSRP